MAITNFIPTIWSENLARSLDQKYIGVAHCNREYEGEIKSCGSTVKICGVGAVDIRDYTKNSDMETPQGLSDTVRELVIDQAKYFNFQIDDIDRAQATPKLMEAAMKVAAEGLANDADKYVYSLYKKTAHTIYCEDVDYTTVMAPFFTAREMLFEAGVTDSSQIVIEVSPKVASIILQAKLKYYSGIGSEACEKGSLGNIVGCPIYASRNIVVTPTDDPLFSHKCLVRTRRAVAFAEQLSEIEAYRPEKRFADAVKGMHLYGANIVYPDEFIVINFTVMPEE